MTPGVLAGSILPLASLDAKIDLYCTFVAVVQEKTTLTAKVDPHG
jgi:hypothetical protein